MIWDRLKDPAVYAALSGLMSALGWEVADKFFDHMIGFLGGMAAIGSIVASYYRERKLRKLERA